jgi:hypothetical protein
MKFKKKDRDFISFICIAASILCVALAGLGYLWKDIWLASTQWMITSAVFGLFGVFLKLDFEK